MGSPPKQSDKAGTPKAVPVCAVRTFSPYLDFLIKIGAPVERWLEVCRLPIQAYEDPAALLPTMNCWSFVSLAERREGIEDLGLLVGRDWAFDALGPRVVTGAHAAPTLLSGIDELARQVRGVYSGMGVVLSRGEDDTVHLTLNKTFDVGVPGFSQTEWMALIGMIGVVRLFAGETWQPDTVSLKSNRAIPPFASALYPDVRFKRSQPRSCISFSRTMLSLGPSNFGAEVVSKRGWKSSDLTAVAPPVDFVDSLQKLVKTYLHDGYPSLDLIAEIVGIGGPRTLQRRLADSGIRYRTLIDRARFEVAAELLTQTDISSLEITHEAGYEDPSHFARGFRRLAGCSPQAYRRRHSAVG